MADYSVSTLFIRFQAGKGRLAVLLSLLLPLVVFTLAFYLPCNSKSGNGSGIAVNAEDDCNIGGKITDICHLIC